jgi:FkbH-like protein
MRNTVGGGQVKLGEALKAVAAARALPVARDGFLVCGFEPLHLPVFLQARFLAREPGQTLRVSHGLFGDLMGNVERARAAAPAVAWVVLEWNDLDPRLGYRSSGPWGGERQADVIASVRARLEALRTVIGGLAQASLVVVVAPSLPFPLFGFTPGWQASEAELTLEHLLAGWLLALAGVERVRVLQASKLAAHSPPAARGDVRAELATGFPYTLEHASALAEALIELAFPAAPKKGLITDLDDTLWAGIVGEVGAAGVGWSQADKAQIHGLYQSLLGQLSEAGVLLAIASKNERDVVDAALARPDVLIGSSAFFPVAVSWGPKSESVSAILRAWNIAADAVVVVDDSLMELEEIRRQHPGITALPFTPKDARAALELLSRLRDLFGKPAVLAKDKLRLASIRNAASFEQAARGADLDDFLAGLDGVVTFDALKRAGNARLLELINKTNQFNLNGLRLSESEWASWLAEPDGVVLGVAYTDRYGALGTIAVVVGKMVEPGVLELAHWVLSCRAFSRRIEEHTLRYLFRAHDCRAIRLSYRQTARNQPFRELLGRLELEPASSGPELARDHFERVVGRLPHRDVVAEGASGGA